MTPGKRVDFRSSKRFWSHIYKFKIYEGLLHVSFYRVIFIYKVEIFIIILLCFMLVTVLSRIKIINFVSVSAFELERINEKLQIQKVR
jgi:hypothetical protein